MPELRAAAKAIWEKSAPTYQKEYAKIRQPQDPESFEELLASRDPLLDVKMRVNLIIKSFDNEIVVSHLNKMHKAVLDVSSSPHKLLLSDRPVCFSNLIRPNGVAFLPISPTKIFVAVNDEKVFAQIRMRKTREIVKDVNTFVASRARRFVWSADRSQETFIEKYMSKKMEPAPLFPSLDKYETPGAIPVDEPQA
jgi:hypothetical protein